MKNDNYVAEFLYKDIVAAAKSAIKRLEKNKITTTRLLKLRREANAI